MGVRVRKIGVGSNLVWVVLLALYGTGCSLDRNPTEIEWVVSAQKALYPDMGAQDWYKLFHQAAMGNRHLGVEDSLIYAYLLGEWDRIEARPEEPLLEYISPDSAIVRINLRPYKAQGGSPAVLFDAMKKTWDTFEPSEDRLVRYLEEVEREASKASLDVSKDALASFFSEQANSGYPAVHHSESYELRYKPAYRVIARKFIP